MRKITTFKCPECGMTFSSMSGWSSHIDRHHPGLKPKGYSDMRFLYYTLTGRTSGRCVQCHGETSWNEENGKYNRFCNNPKCKQEYAKMAKQRMVDKYGKTHLLNDPEMQRKMLKGREISGTYKFSDNSGSVDYVGTYEKDFLYVMDHIMKFKATDIMGPSPHNYIYMYEGKPHVYIPDFYIPNYNLEVEIKTDENKHHKIQAVDKVKEKLKDDMMNSNPSVNYFKILDKNYTDFFKYLTDKKFEIDEVAMENVNKYLETGAKEASMIVNEFTAEQTESALTADERTDFGIPELKKYPMPDAEHVKLAIKFFNHVDSEHEKELASNINKYIEKYNITDITVGENNRFSKYYKKI